MSNKREIYGCQRSERFAGVKKEGFTIVKEARYLWVSKKERFAGKERSVVREKQQKQWRYLRVLVLTIASLGLLCVCVCVFVCIN